MPRYLLATTALAALATAPAAAQSFNRIASFNVSENILDGDPNVTTSAEIIAASPDGMTLIYTDSPLGAVGLIDITDPADPQPLGHVETEGEPTAVAVSGGTAFVGLNTSDSFVEPSGNLAAFDMETMEFGTSCPLSGQPDSVATDGQIVAVAIENERDEDLDDGVIPQLPAGTVDIFRLDGGSLDCDSLVSAEITGLAGVAPSDPEPEFLDINGEGEIVVTLQENNHIVVLSSDGTVLSDFSAGAVDLTAIDTEEEGAILLTSEQMGRKREPDSVKWIDDTHFAIANEGDYEGGSRGWTIMSQEGEVVYESGTTFEYALIEIGHYPEERSGNKGVEPESIEAGTFGGVPMAFVGSERGSIVGVYDISTPAEPELAQLLPSGIGPEGILALPERNLLVVANEEDLIEDGGVRAHVMIFEFGPGEPSYPSITSAGSDPVIGWGALSGLAAHPTEAGRLYAVNDSFYGMQPTIFEIDATGEPALITGAIRITREGAAAQKLDLEGIHANDDGTFFVASEGRPGRMIPHGIYHVGPDGAIEDEIAFPKELRAVERRWASEGITRIGDTLWIAIQREFDDDPANHVKLVSYDLETEEWGAVLYPKAEPETGWVGLSEITAHGDFVYIVERDNQIGANAVLKKLYRVPLAEMEGAALAGDLPIVSKEEVHDFLPDLAAPNGYIVDKIEGFAIDAAGEGFAVTDNDGVDDSSGETHFFSVGSF